MSDDINRLLTNNSIRISDKILKKLKWNIDDELKFIVEDSQFLVISKAVKGLNAVDKIQEILAKAALRNTD